MAGLIATGNVAGLLQLDAEDLRLDDSQIDSVLAQIISDASAGFQALVDDNYDVDAVSTTQLQATIFGSAPGQLTVRGTGFMLFSGKISSLTFDPASAGSWNWRLSGSGSWSASNVRVSSITAAEIWNDSRSITYAVRGNIVTDANLNASGTLNSLTVTANGTTLVIKGQIDISDDARGTIREISLSDGAGNALNLKGAFPAASLGALIDSASNVGEVFDSPLLLAGNDTMVVPSNARAWSGFGGNDQMTGGALGDTLDGGLGNDRLLGLAGDDSLLGGAGNDIVDGGDGNDTLGGGDGNDRLVGGTGDDALAGGTGNDVLEGGSGNDALDGGEGNDRLTDLSGHNTVVDSGGNNNVITGAGNDAVTTGGGNDLIRTGEGNNTVSGGAGNDRITAGSGNDLLQGGDGTDGIVAGAGNDTLSGGAGTDQLTGGLGADNFLFGAAPDGLADLIRDFRSAEGDRIVLSTAVFSMLSVAGGLDGRLVSAPAAVALDADDYLLFDTATRKLFYDADANGAGAAIVLATLAGVGTLGTGDLMLA